jgi:hypothetical protein
MNHTIENIREELKDGKMPLSKEYFDRRAEIDGSSGKEAVRGAVALQPRGAY